MRILNFGSLNMDYVYSVEHFVCPGETISSTKLEIFCGGKGLNQSIALARAGVQVSHAGKIGKDGEILTNCLEKEGVDISLIRQSDCPSGHAIIQVDQTGQNCILLYGGANQTVEANEVDAVLSEFRKGDILLLQNEINCMEYIMKKAYEKGMRIALNPSPMNSKIKSYSLEYVTWFILNEIEGTEITGEKEPEAIAGKLLARYPAASVVLTLGKRGVMYKDSHVTFKHGIYNVPVVDTTAAGDTFTGYFLACVTEGLPVDEVLKKASIASSIAVSRMGASDSVPRRREVEESDIKLYKSY